MNNPAIEQALLELEISLGQIKSANENVNSVSQKCEQLIITMSKVISSLNDISSNLKIDKGAIEDKLAENNKAFHVGLTKILNNANDAFNESHRKISYEHQIFSQDLKTGLKDTLTNLKGEIESFKAYNNTALNLINEEIDVFNESIRSLQESINKSEKSLNELDKRIVETNFKSEFDLLNKSLSARNNILMVINIIVLSGVLALILLR